MSGYFLWIVLLAVWHTILFFAKEYGLNVMLFIIPLMGYMYYVLKKNNKIKNKNGLLYMIPIILLSVVYLLFNNELFIVLDFFAIPVLIAIMYIETTDSTYKVLELFKKIIFYLFVPFKYIGRVFRVTIMRLKKWFKMTDKTSKIIKVLLIVIPISIVVIALLSSADIIFGRIFGELLDYLLEILDIEFLDRLLGRITVFIIMFFIIGCTTMYIMYEKNNAEVVKKETKNRDLLVSKVLLCVLNVIYIIFDFIQIKSLIFHNVASNIDYASYARRGFFELLVVSLINLTIILITRRFENKENTKEFKFIKIMDIIMIFLTIVIIASSFLRMHMYEVEYGYTVLRLLVFAALITEAILMIPTVMFIFNKEFNIVKSYMIITLVAFLILNFMDMDYIIAKKNVGRYYYTKDIDLDYLQNYRYDNIPILVDFYNNHIEDKKIKHELRDYLYTMKMNANSVESSIFEFNISHFRAKRALDRANMYDKEIEYRDYLED